MTDTGKLNEIRAAVAELDEWHGRKVDLPFVDRVRAILDRPAAAPAEPREDFDDDHEALNERNPLDDEPAPRTLLGWTVPVHVDAYPNGSVICRHSCHDGISPGRVVNLRDPEESAVVKHFLLDHSHGTRIASTLGAHGSVVEHQPAQDSGGQKYHAQVAAEEARDAAYAERDLALWLHAEAVFFGEGWHQQWMSTRATVHKLQARIDAALALCEPHPLRHWDTQWPIRAALQGEQPTEEADRG
ncbi:hypothetical protein AB0383_20270 [Amycolatopsis sp. NPDC051373]|uniref:hypothetical protein n=1 Tax=Amycolatopsis sp. NPDC051373 TaxID=3155801 RepID=UPI00344E1F74